MKYRNLRNAWACCERFVALEMAGLVSSLDLFVRQRGQGTSLRVVITVVSTSVRLHGTSESWKASAEMRAAAAAPANLLNLFSTLFPLGEQNLLLKVMERKIKTAKSTIPGARKSSHQQSTPAILKPRNTCSLEWNFSDLTRRLPLVRASNPKATASLSPRQLNQRDLMAKHKDKKEKKFNTSPKKPKKAGGVTIHELKDGDEDEKCSSVSGTDVETEGPDVSDGFLTDDFEDTDDDLLSHLWNTCKREDGLLEDDVPLPKQRRIGPPTAALIYLNTTTVLPRSEPSQSKENRPRRILSLAKTSKVKETQVLSKFMKKREEGWRE